MLWLLQFSKRLSVHTSLRIRALPSTIGNSINRNTQSVRPLRAVKLYLPKHEKHGKKQGFNNQVHMLLVFIQKQTANVELND